MMRSSAVVTGAAQGIGLAVVRRLLREDVAVVGMDIDEAAMTDAAANLGAGFTAIQGDIRDWDTHERAADVAEACGPLRRWVNNAGMDLTGAAHEVTSEQVTQGLGTLAAGTMFGASVAVRRMLRGGGGAIVNVSSIHAVAAFPRAYTYAASKSAVLMATRSIAVDYGAFGIRCNAVLPGVILTRLTEAVLPPTSPREEALAVVGDLAPQRRVGDPDEVAAVVVFLLSEDASYINGAAVPVDGGATARCYAYPTLDDPLG